MEVAQYVIIFALLCASCTAQEAKPDDRWYNMNSVGFHHHGEVSTTELTEPDAKKYFSKERPFVSELFRKQILNRLLEKNIGKEFKPTKSHPPRDPRCFAQVSKFNKKEVHIRILKPLGGIIIFNA